MRRDGIGGKVADLRAEFADAPEQPFGLDGADGGVDRGGRERAARERRGVQQRVRVERREQPRGCHHAADGHHAAAEDLAREQRVRRDAGQVSAPPGAEPAHAGLDLIQDHHGACLGARLPDLPQVAVGRQPDAALGLDRLEQHHRLGRQHGPECGEVAERYEVDHRQQRAERVAEIAPVRSPTARRASCRGIRHAWRSRDACRPAAPASARARSPRLPSSSGTRSPARPA